MDKPIVGLLSIFFVQPTHSALAPQYQNINDLDVMVNFVKAHPVVAESLRRIDLGDYVIFFGDGCKARFARKHVERPAGWAGPSEPLELKESNCPVD
jgi:hypothetical protein